MKTMKISTHMIKMMKLGQFINKSFRVPFMNRSDKPSYYQKDQGRHKKGELRVKKLSTPYEFIKFLAVGGNGKYKKDIETATKPNYEKEATKVIKSHNEAKSSKSSKDIKIAKQNDEIKSLKAKLASRSHQSSTSTASSDSSKSSSGYDKDFLNHL